MSTSGTTFTDWEQVEADRNRPLLVDEDFSWSEPPARPRRSRAEPARPARTRRPEPEYLGSYEAAHEPEAGYPPEPSYTPEAAQSPAPSRRSFEPSYASEPYASEPRRVPARAARAERRSYASESESREPAAPHSIDVERELDVAWGGRLSASSVDSFELVPSGFAQSGEMAVEPSGRRTVVITGRGADRFPVGARRHTEAGLAFHERSGFSPDRMAMWAVVMGLALLLGCIIH